MLRFVVVVVEKLQQKSQFFARDELRMMKENLNRLRRLIEKKNRANHHPTQNP